MVLATPANAAIDLQSAIDSIKDFITGTFAKSAAVIALAFQGYRFYTGRASAGGLIAVIGGCFLIFGADWIMTKLGIS
jgi:type IV secretion system protein VirB2